MHYISESILTRHCECLETAFLHCSRETNVSWVGFCVAREIKVYVAFMSDGVIDSDSDARAATSDCVPVSHTHTH